MSDKVKNNKMSIRVHNEPRLNKAAALKLARQVVGSKHSVHINGAQIKAKVKQKQQSKVDNLAATLLKKGEAKVVAKTAVAHMAGVKTLNNNNRVKDTKDPLDTLAKVEESNKEEGSEDENAAERVVNAAYYVLSHSIKNLASKFVKLFETGTKNRIEESEGYAEEYARSVKEVESTSGA